MMIFVEISLNNYQQYLTGAPIKANKKAPSMKMDVTRTRYASRHAEGALAPTFSGLSGESQRRRHDFERDFLGFLFFLLI